MSRKSAFLLVLLMAVLPLSLIAGSEHNSDAWLGIYTQTVDEDLTEAFDLDSDYGVIVKTVIDESPADKAGLKQGDIILEFNGNKLQSADDLTEYVHEEMPGDKVELIILRDGQRKNLDAELGSRSENDSDNYYFWQSDKNAPNTYSKVIKNFHSSMTSTYIGVSLQNLNQQLGEYFGVEDAKGVLVTEVMDDSPAKKAGLEAGDVIIGIDGDEVEDPSDVQEVIRAKEEGDEVTIAVLRNKAKQDFSLTIAKSPDNSFLFGNDPMAPFDDDFLFIPKAKGLFNGRFDNDIFDSKEMQEELENLKEELNKMHREIKELHEKLE